ncbi:hypothetical protein GCM10009804_56950 [Kribbella hippodromi]|uniref:Methyltransferase domain-containing protein n=1 Tax=Kribbella hippodromi TaxID=434347 RepID=A0ABN2E379_9ACTN
MRVGQGGSGPGPHTPDGSAVELYEVTPVHGEDELINGAIDPGSTVLELGCGTGRITRALAALGHHVVAVDESPDMIARVREPSSGPPPTQPPTGPTAQSPTAESPATSTPAQSPATSPQAQSPGTSTPAESPAPLPPVQSPATSTPAETPATSTPAKSPATSTPAETPAASLPAETPATSTPAETPAASLPAEPPGGAAGIETVCSTIGELRLERRFDLVLMMSYLINVADDAERLRLLQTCAYHVRPGGSVILQQQTPGMLRGPVVMTSDRGTMVISDLEEFPDGRQSATLTHTVGGKSWSQHILTQNLTEDQLARQLAEAGLHRTAYLTPDQTWVVATPTT